MVTRKRRAKSGNVDARLAAIEAVEEAAHKLEEASDRYEKASRALMDAAHDKSEADKALRASLAELQQAKGGKRTK
jgi:prefoldin subunit 5